MQEFVKMLKEKLPRDNIHTGMVISIARDRKLEDKVKVLEYLQNQENECREWLAKNKNAAMNSKRRDYSRKLEEIQSMKQLLEKI
ncbi:hypothetical protein FJZ53_01320 [Candidatus Woesearchaeota archaeon]|nr:hypothetical protein [Candidatus Woesearchaeota archaeon]